MMARPTYRRLSFQTACAQYINRFTMDHVPAHTQQAAPNGQYYAPQFASDREWYDHTLFPGEKGWLGLRGDTHCFTTGQTWPLGQWLDVPYRSKVDAGCEDIDQSDSDEAEADYSRDHQE